MNWISQSNPAEVNKMEIIVNLDVMMAKRKISAGDLAQRVGITPANLSILKNNKAKAIRFSTLVALCHELQCQPGDILEYREVSN
jgi:putative transcriptional regulator